MILICMQTHIILVVYMQTEHSLKIIISSVCADRTYSLKIIISSVSAERVLR